MRSRNLIWLGIAATLACCLVEFSQTHAIVSYYRETLSAPIFACWAVGLVVATISPPTCAILFWSLAKRLERGWILHLSLVPATYALAFGSAALMLLAVDEPDLDSLTGHSLLPATLLFLISPTGYFIALAVQKIGDHRFRGVR